MQTNSKILLSQSNLKKRAISLTTYRAIYIAKLLTISPMSYDEIISALINDNFLFSSCHKDTILNSINSLRLAGFEIDGPTPANDYKFSLISHPLKMQFNGIQAEIMSLIRNSLYYQNNYELIFDINDVYNKIISFCNVADYVDLIEGSNNLRNIDKAILEECIDLSRKKGNAVLVYDSPTCGEERLRIKAEKIVFENNRLYLWLYSYKYNAVSYLRIDKIKKIEKENDSSFNVKFVNIVEFELWGAAAKNFIPKEEEIIVSGDNDRIIVRVNFINKFNFYQRILSFAKECRILYPEDIRSGFIKYLSELIEDYNENKI